MQPTTYCDPVLGTLTWLATYKQSKWGGIESLCGLHTGGMLPAHVKTKMRHDMESFSGTNELPSSYTRATPELHCFCLCTKLNDVWLRSEGSGERPMANQDCLYQDDVNNGQGKHADTLGQQSSVKIKGGSAPG